MLDFRNDAERIIAQVHEGQSVILTPRGKPVARLGPIVSDVPSADDPFYRLCDRAEAGESLINQLMDEIVPGS